jgi:hypothetical protein
LILGWALSACAGNATAPIPTDTPTPSPPTPEATITLEPSATPPPPTDTALPPTATPTFTPEPPCVNDAQFVADLTIPDGKQYLPGQADVKKWSVQNSGTCDWGPGYRLVLVSGDSLSAPSEVALYPAKAGAAAVWEIPIVVPQTPGQYASRWQARDPEGNLFGTVTFIEIEVIALPVTDTPTP